MKVVWGVVALGVVVLAEPKRDVIDCNIIFEQRKSEILRGIEKIDEQQQALQALQVATQAMLDQKEAALKAREAEVAAVLSRVEEKEQRIRRLVKQNEEVLKQIKSAKDDKIAETYAKMKDSKAAPIIENLSDEKAATILFSLESKDMGKILAKMNPTRAAELTAILQKGPPFEKESNADSSVSPASVTPQAPAISPALAPSSTMEESPDSPAMPEVATPPTSSTL